MKNKKLLLGLAFIIGILTGIFIGKVLRAQTTSTVPTEVAIIEGANGQLASTPKRPFRHFRKAPRQ